MDCMHEYSVLYINATYELKFISLFISGTHSILDSNKHSSILHRQNAHFYPRFRHKAKTLQACPRLKPRS
ncbi:GTPase-activating protein [Fusarium oxysporum f. sp. albedinis]|nr:GTPase-activating protein [Fusarium oxysporum f. sp. albedinis]